MLETLRLWLADHLGTLFASIAGAAIHVTVTWQSPILALRHFITAALVASLFGPGIYSMLQTLTPFDGESIRYGCIGAAALGGVYTAEGSILLWKRWSENPTIPFPWRKP